MYSVDLITLDSFSRHGSRPYRLAEGSLKSYDGGLGRGRLPGLERDPRPGYELEPAVTPNDVSRYNPGTNL